jgi:hypothetical protein
MRLRWIIPPRDTAWEEVVNQNGSHAPTLSDYGAHERDTDYFRNSSVELEADAVTPRYIGPIGHQPAEAAHADS